MAIGALIGTALTSVGVGASTAAVLGPALATAGMGAAIAGISGGNPLYGALGGGLLGGIQGAGGLSGIFGGGGAGAGSISYATPADAPSNLSGPGGLEMSLPNMSAAQSLAGTAGSVAGGTSRSSTGGLGSLAALGALASMFSSPQRPNYSMTPGPNDVQQSPYWNQSMPSGQAYYNRTPVQNYQPSTGNWYTWGEQPEKQFFNNNQLNLNQPVPAPVMPPGYARGGAMMRPFDTNAGDAHVRGPGDGQSDSVPARLSNGEYVLTAKDVSSIGRGSNEAGARKIDMARRKGPGALSGLLRAA